MLRPFQEFSTPRHILQDNQFDNNEQDVLQEQEPIIPHIKIDHHLQTESDYFVAVPEVLDLVGQSLISLGGDDVKHLSTISISFPTLDDTVQEDEYDDDEQLYKSSSSHSIAKKDEKQIKLHQIQNKDGEKINFLTIPNFQNKLIYNLLSNQIFNDFNISQLIGLGTSELNSGDTINLLASSKSTLDKIITKSPILSNISLIRPPHTLTGSIGSIVAGSVFQNVDTFAIVVAAEGAFHLDLERYNYDALQDLVVVLDEYLKLSSSKKSFVKSVENKLKYRRAGSGDSSLYL